MSAGADDNAQEKSLDPTPSRLERARREGDIALSREANAAAAYLGLYVVIIAGSGALAMGLLSIIQPFLAQPEKIFPMIINGRSGEVALKIAAAAAALFIAPALCVAAAIHLQQGFVFAPSKLKPKLSRLSIPANAKQKFGPEGLAEFLIAALKLVGVLVLFGAFMWSRFLELPGKASLTAPGLLEEIHESAALFIGVILVFAAAVGAIDVLRVRSQRHKRLMMSLDEIKRESKENEGDPHFKAKRRERSRAIATNRMLLDVPEANVVLVNPTHFAVALKWGGPKSGAPVCVAKGADELAAKIKEIAILNGVPVRRDASTTRAIFSAVEVGEEIRREHYAAVAAAIHYAEAVRKAARS